MESNSTDRSVQRVRDIMTTPVHTVMMDDSILSLKSVFDAERFHHVVVLDEGNVVGVVSDRDVLKAISPFVGSQAERTRDAATLKRRVHQIMSRHPVTIGPDESIMAAARKMLVEHVSCLPVVEENGPLLGIVTFRDVVVRTAGLPNQEPDAQPEPQDEGVLIIIDGARCYAAHVSLGRQIREAEKRYTEKKGSKPTHPTVLPRFKAM